MDVTLILGLAAAVSAGLALAILVWALSAVRAGREEAAALRERLDALAEEAQTLRVELGRREEAVAAREARIRQADEAHAALAGDLRASREAEGALRARVSELQTTLDHERRAHEEKVKLLSEVRKDMEDRFRQLADETMRRHGEDFSKSNKEKLDAVLSPLKEHVGRFEQELRAVHQGAAKDRERLKAEIEQLTRRSEEVSKEALNLTRALKGDKQRQGAWGEMVLASLLERSGLREGEEYEVQVHRTDEEGGRFRPDVIVRLPGDKRLVVDSKVSLVAYEQAVNAADEEIRAAALRAHVAAVRAHIDTLADKKYHALEEGSVDYVIMFMPIEGALSEALRERGDLTGYAVERNVMIATPTTLMMALRTIENVWAVEKRNRNAEKIADRAGRLYDKMALFVSEMEKVGRKLGEAQEAHGLAMDRLSRGRGNVLSQFDTLKRLGARTAKALPSDFDGDDDAPEDEAPGGGPGALPSAAE